MEDLNDELRDSGEPEFVALPWYLRMCILLSLTPSRSTLQEAACVSLDSIAGFHQASLVTEFVSVSCCGKGALIDAGHWYIRADRPDRPTESVVGERSLCNGSNAPEAAGERLAR